MARLANIEAQLQLIEATQSKNDFNFDNSALSRAKKTVSELEESLDVMARQAEIEGRYGDLDGPSAYRRSSSRHREGSRRAVRPVRLSSRCQGGRQEPLRRDRAARPALLEPEQI